MTAALRRWEAGHSDNSSLKAGSGYSKLPGSGLRVMSLAGAFRPGHWDPSTQAAITADRYGCWPRLGLLKEPLQEVGVPQAAFVLEPIRRSGPVQFVLKLLDCWQLTEDDAVFLLGFDESDIEYVRAVLGGRATLRGRDIRDRIAHLFQIRKTLSALFRDLDVENEWLREPHVLLQGREPLKLLLGGSMESLLLVKEYVDAAAGR